MPPPPPLLDAELPEKVELVMVEVPPYRLSMPAPFFEVLLYGIPTVVFSPYGTKDNSELKALSKESVAMVVNTPKLAIEGLVELMSNDELSKVYSMNALKKMAINGVHNFSKEIYSLIGLK